MGFLDWLLRRKEVTAGGSRVVRHEYASKREAGVTGEPAWKNQREAHYREWLGPDEFVYRENVPRKPHIHIHVISPKPEEGRDYTTLVTDGMSDLRMEIPGNVNDAVPRAEIIAYLRDFEGRPDEEEPPVFVKYLFFLATFPFNFGTWLDWYHTIPNGDPPRPIIEGSNLTTAFFLPPIAEPEGFRNGLRLEDDPVRFLWLTFITEAESRLKREQGAETLVEAMRKAGYPPWVDFDRDSLVE
jgi:hypothetical protein